MKYWMWALPVVGLGVIGALYEAGGSAGRKAEFVNRCTGSVEELGASHEVSARVCSCILERGEQFAQQHPQQVPGKDDLAGYLKECGAANGIDLSGRAHNPWR